MKTLLCKLPLVSCLAVFALPAFGFDGHDEPDALPGALYTMDNAVGTNHVWAFARAANGSLGTPAVVSTGGAGTGSALENQGAVRLSRDGRWLVVCNAGSDELSVFSVSAQGLTLTDKVGSQGQMPISIALHGDLLYVLNAGGEVAGGSDSIAGFVFAYGHLFPLPGAVCGLSSSNTAPAEIAFTSDGKTLVVTEKGTGLIDTFTVSDGGIATLAKTYSSPAPPPYGFAVGRGDRIFVAQAAGGASNPGASSVSSYLVGSDGSLETISGSVATHQTAACWLALAHDQRFAYTANTPNDSVSSFWVGRDGSLQLLKSQAALPGTGSHPADMGLTLDDRFLYTVNGNGSISGFAVDPFDGSLRPASSAIALPATINGVAVR